MENYFNYFTEIEEHFQQRRGGILLLSTLDWALIETWKDAGIPLDAVLRGIDAAFEQYEKRPSKSRKVNSLAYCAQEVLAATEEMKEAAIGTKPANTQKDEVRGFDPAEIAAFLLRNAEKLDKAELPETAGLSGRTVALQSAQTLRALAAELENDSRGPRLEHLERTLTVLEEKLLAVLMAASPDAEIVAIRADADRELRQYRAKMPASQIAQLQTQYLRKRLLEKHSLPRLSLFYL
ncbi:MAG: hypothetical protein JOY93_09260 [Acidobacteriales bacterium]|nr:hypothetical protein [Terriglobales bacterium]